MIRKLSSFRQQQDPALSSSPCEHRIVSKDGRIICRKIAEGDNVVTPNLCRACPVKAVNCCHLCFSLRQTSPRPLIVRFNGRTEVWDDDPPELHFQQAACTVKVVPIGQPQACTGCELRQPVQATGERPAPRRRQVVGGGKVVPFPGRGAVVAAG
jgi:hypothetical protein